MIAPRLDTGFRLADSRFLAYAEYGDPDAAPVFLFHGLPGSRLAWGSLPVDPFPEGIRVVAPDRPGYGRSDPKPDRSLLDWADDVFALADHLSLDRFSVIGVSGGGPGALACAAKSPSRIKQVGVVVGPAPTNAPGVFSDIGRVNRFFLKLAWRAPFLSNMNTRLVARVVRSRPGWYVDVMQRKLHEVDRAVLAQPGFRDFLIGDFTEALRNGSQGMVDVGRPNRDPAAT